MPVSFDLDAQPTGDANDDAVHHHHLRMTQAEEDGAENSMRATMYQRRQENTRFKKLGRRSKRASKTVVRFLSEAAKAPPPLKVAFPLAKKHSFVDPGPAEEQTTEDDEEYIIYHPPLQHRDWDEPEESQAAPWFASLYDLLYVAMAYKVGNLYCGHFHKGEGE